MALRYQIIDELAARLALIDSGTTWQFRTGETYQCSSEPGLVGNWKTTPATLAQLPAIIWRDTVEKNNQNRYFGNPDKWDLTIRLGAYATTAAAARTLAEDILATVCHDPTFDMLVDWTYPESIELRHGVKGDTDIFAVLLAIRVAYSTWDDEGLTDEAGNLLTAETGLVLTWKDTIASGYQFDDGSSLLFDDGSIVEML